MDRISEFNTPLASNRIRAGESLGQPGKLGSAPLRGHPLGSRPGCRKSKSSYCLKVTEIDRKGPATYRATEDRMTDFAPAKELGGVPGLGICPGTLGWKSCRLPRPSPLQTSAFLFSLIGPSRGVLLRVDSFLLPAKQ